MTKLELRLKAWIEGELDDGELTQLEIKELERRVYSAITRKLHEGALVTLHPQHRTVQ